MWQEFQGNKKIKGKVTAELEPEISKVEPSESTQQTSLYSFISYARNPVKASRRAVRCGER
jgi:hypothetical protein